MKHKYNLLLFVLEGNRLKLLSEHEHAVLIKNNMHTEQFYIVF